MKVAERVELKSAHHKKRKLCNYVWWWVLSRLTVVLISQYVQILNHFAVYLKLIMFYVNYTSIHFFLNFIFFYTAGSYWLSILYILVYTCQSQSPNSAHHHPHPTAVFPPWCPYVCSLHLCLNFYPANWFICTIFLGSTCMRDYTIFVFLFLTYFTLYDSL